MRITGRVDVYSHPPPILHTAPRATAPPLAPQPGRVKRVLIVDDEDDIREVAQLSLEMMAGWEVISASSGQHALAAAVREQPDVILLDVMMPGMDGLTTARRLHEEPRTAEIPVILLTAKVPSSEDRPFRDLHVAGVISKPFDPISLADQVTRILESS